MRDPDLEYSPEHDFVLLRPNEITFGNSLLEVYATFEVDPETGRLQVALTVDDITTIVGLSEAEAQMFHAWQTGGIL